MKNQITTFTISSTDFEKWAHQNRAEYTGDYFAGCLLDNFIVTTKNNGLAAVYEKPLNVWSSCYYIEFARDDRLQDDIYNKFVEIGLIIEKEWLKDAAT